jgi:phosphoserine phosphatase
LAYADEIEEAIAEHGATVESLRTLGTAIVHARELEVRAPERLTRAKLDQALRAIGERWPGLDAVVQTETVTRQPRRLVAFDMDSTLITVETMNEIARVAGIAEQVTPITTRANLGTIDFDESLRQRVALLKGFPEAPLRALAATTPLTPGAELLVSTLRRHGHRVAVLSAGFTWFCDDVRARLSIDRVHSNVLEVEDGRLTGRLVGPIVNARLKGELLERLLEEEGLPLEAAVAIGDGANDAVMLARAGLGIAFHGKTPAREAASARLTQPSIAAVLYLLGMTDDDIGHRVPSRSEAPGETG